MPIIQVGYKVPLSCTVDTETGEITRVFLADEEIALDGTFNSESGEPISWDEAPMARAVELADSDFWPAWERR